MIYTSYFPKVNKLVENGLIPIAICGGIPEGYIWRWYRKLAPSWSIYSEYKEFGDIEKYTKRYNEEILSKLNPEQVFQDLYNLADESVNFAMLCYEKPTDFCHRHLVADWFTKYGFTCKEWKDFSEF